MRALGAATLLAVAAFAKASDYDLTADFSTTANPNGPWAYGATSTLGGSFVPDVGDSDVYRDGWIGLGGSNIWKAKQQNPYSVLTGEVSLHPGQGGQVAVARFTVPESGVASLVGKFKSGAGGAVDVFVLHNGTPLFSVLGTGGEQPFAVSQPIVIGDTIDFAVGSAGGWDFDNTPTFAHISINPVPEPASLAALGLVALALMRRRKAR